MPLDRLTGQVAVGATFLLRTEEYALVGGNVAMLRWFRNIGIGGSISWAVSSSSHLVMGDVGVRLLGASGPSGPFLGGGFGFRRIDLDNKKVGGFQGSETGLGAYVEVGVLVRGLVTASLRGDVPFFGIEGRETGASSLTPKARLVPIALTAQIGVMF